MKNKNNTHNKRKGSNRRLSDTYLYTGDQETKTSIRLVQYTEEKLEVKEVTSFTSFLPLVDPACVNWIHINGLNNALQITSLVKEFGLHHLDAKDVLTPEHVVKVEVADKHVLIILNDCYYDVHGILQREHLSLLLTENAVLSFSEGNHPFYEGVLHALQNNLLGIRSKRADTLLAFLLNQITVNLVDSASRIEDMLEDLEEQLLDINADHSSFRETIQTKRHEFLAIKKNAQPLKEQFSKLLLSGSPFIRKETLPLFSDSNDQLTFVIQSMESCREIISSLVDLYIANNDLRMNAIMKRLTVMSTIFIPLTFLVGVWGMNFKQMPELDWRYGYVIAWTVMILSGVFTWLYLKRKKWD